MLLCCIGVGARDNDVKTTDKQSSSSFINASSDSKPREISLGLPISQTGKVTIFEDGLPVSINLEPIFPYKSWHCGVGGEMSNIGPMETAIRCNEINYYVYSTSRTGMCEKVGGAASYTFGQYCQHKLDLYMHGPISNKGWYFSLSAYQNFDPGSNRLNCSKYQNRHQFYKGIISKEFKNGKGNMSLALQYVDYFEIKENYGPFIFVGDGSVKQLDGFKLGHDSYLPQDTQMTFLDMKTGKMVTRDLNLDNCCNTFSAVFNLSYNFGSTSNLVVRSRFKWSDMEDLSRSIQSVASVGKDAEFTYTDGTPYSGNLQYRSFLNKVSYEHSWMNNAEFSKRFLPSLNARFGADLNISSRGAVFSSANCAHEVCANPQTLYLKGNAYFNYNSSGQYYEGVETKAMLYGQYDWKIAENWMSEGFVRAGVNIIDGKAANNIGDDRSNTRFPGYNLTVGKITDVKCINPEWAVGFNVRYRIKPQLQLNLEPIFTSSHTTISDYCSAYLPTTKPTQTLLLRAGLTYSTESLNLSAQITYISQDKKVERTTFAHKLTKDVGDMKAGTYESRILPIEYGISSLGLVADANWIHRCGFSLHGQIMLRNPKYKNFRFDPTFSDGVTEHYDFSGKHITAMPQVELTLDPSYKIKNWKFYLTARYLSRTYINKTNTLFFSGRVETFAGIDFALNKHLLFKLDLINLLNQTGAKGTIPSADLVEDTSQYTNYLMAGTFIRPFTVELGVTVTL